MTGRFSLFSCFEEWSGQGKWIYYGGPIELYHICMDQGYTWYRCICSARALVFGVVSVEEGDRDLYTNGYMSFGEGITHGHWCVGNMGGDKTWSLVCE